jgi:outer membrane lipoprotein SlyB
MITFGGPAATLAAASQSLSNWRGNPIMMITRSGMILVLALGAAACAPASQSYQPMIDRGVPPPLARNEYQDVAECRQYAEQISPAGSAAKSGLIGALVGAAGGAAIGAAVGAPGTGAAIGAAAGGVGGATYGATGANQSQEDVIRNCMRGRGWRVLN